MSQKNKNKNQKSGTLFFAIATMIIVLLQPLISMNSSSLLFYIAISGTLFLINFFLSGIKDQKLKNFIDLVITTLVILFLIFELIHFLRAI
jgi:hypothetical protein